MNELETVENKGLLWNLLTEGKVFNNIPETRIDLIKLHFENKIKEIKRGSTGNDTLIELNKKIIKDLMKELETYRTIQKKEEIQRVENVIEERKNSFAVGLEKHRLDMNNQLNIKAPEEIDFSDKNKDIPIKNYEDMMREREEDLKGLHIKEKTLKIGENVELENNILEIPKKKNVTFSIDEKENGEEKKDKLMDDFISKLKKEKVSKDEIEEKINKAINELVEIKELIKNYT